MKNVDILEETVKKSELQANYAYDFHKLAAAGEHFLPMKWEEQEEAIVFTYNIRKLTPFSEICKEEYVTILNLLMQAARFQKDIESYSFSMELENLYCNTNGEIVIKSRDLASAHRHTETEFLVSYKALIACALTGQYNYKDYREGGEELLQKHPATAPLFEIMNVEEIVRYLEELKQNYILKQKATKVYVNKKMNIALKISAFVLLLLTVLLGIYSSIQYFDTVPRLTAVNNAGNAYIETDYVALIDALKGIETEDLDQHQKYILALAYLQSESLANEQKSNIAGKLTWRTNEKELAYWISIGRLDAEQAENLAMQLSDDELLLYAYMKDKSQIESDTALTGQEKEQALKEIQVKIDELADKYELQEDEKITDEAADKAAEE